MYKYTRLAPDGELIQQAGQKVWKDKDSYRELIEDGIENELNKMSITELKEFIK